MADTIHLRMRRVAVSACVLAALLCGAAQNSLAQENVVTYPGPGDFSPTAPIDPTIGLLNPTWVLNELNGIGLMPCDYPPSLLEQVD